MPALLLAFWSSPAYAAKCRVEVGSACSCYIARDLTFHPVAPGAGSVASPISSDRLDGFGIARHEYSNTVGIDWTVTLSPATTPSTDGDVGLAAATGNGISELVELSDVSWAMLNLPANAAAAGVVQINEPTCEILSADIYYRSAPLGLPWTNAMPSETSAHPILELSFVQSMLHELGHAAGLAHDNEIIGLMDATIQSGGNAGIGVDSTGSPLARLNADEQGILSDLYPGGSAGREFLLYKFERIPKASPPSAGQHGKSREIWTDHAAASPFHNVPEGWAACPGERLVGDPHPPWQPYAAMQSSQVELYTATVRFGLAPPADPMLPPTADLGTCGASPQVAYNDGVQLVTGVPRRVHPVYDDPVTGALVGGWCIPTATPPGLYRACAYVVDGDSTDHDDEVYSDKLFQVEPIGPLCCRQPAENTVGCDGVLLPVCP